MTDLFDAGSLIWKDCHLIYLSPEYLNWRSQGFAELLGIERDDGTEVFLPFSLRKYPTGLVVLDVLSDSFSVDGARVPLSENEWKYVMQNLNNRADVVQCLPVRSMTENCPPNAHRFPISTVLLDTSKDEEQLWKELHPRHRNHIRRATRKNLEVRIITSLEDTKEAYCLIRETQLRNDNDSISEDRFLQLLNALENKIVLFGVYLGEELHGAALYPYSKHSACYLFGGSLEFPADGALKLLHWEAMRYFKNLGVKCFDLQGMRVDPEEGSKYAGLKRFKERFGGEVVMGYVWRVINSPLKYRIHRSVQHLVSLVKHGKLSYGNLLERTTRI